MTASEVQVVFKRTRSSSWSLRSNLHLRLQRLFRQVIKCIQWTTPAPSLARPHSKELEFQAALFGHKLILANWQCALLLLQCDDKQDRQHWIHAGKNSHNINNKHDCLLNHTEVYLCCAFLSDGEDHANRKMLRWSKKWRWLRRQWSGLLPGQSVFKCEPG